MGIWGCPMPGPHIGCAGGGAAPAVLSVQHRAKWTARYTMLEPLDVNKRRSDDQLQHNRNVTGGLQQAQAALCLQQYNPLIATCVMSVLDSF